MQFTDCTLPDTFIISKSKNSFSDMMALMEAFGKDTKFYKDEWVENFIDEDTGEIVSIDRVQPTLAYQDNFREKLSFSFSLHPGGGEGKVWMNGDIGAAELKFKYGQQSYQQGVEDRIESGITLRFVYNTLDGKEHRVDFDLKKRMSGVNIAKYFIKALVGYGKHL